MSVLADVITGIFLPKGCVFTRNTADTGIGRIQPLADGEFEGSVRHVVEALPQWAETHSLIRYPSPDRRSCTWLCRPPLFSPACAWSPGRRQLAQKRLVCQQSFDLAPKMTLSAVINEQEKRGNRTCEPVIGSFLAYSRLAALRPVAKTSPGRRSSARVRARALRLSWADPSPRAPSLAPRATSPIARSTRTAANLIRPARGTREPFWTTDASSGAGGLFHVETDVSGTGPRDEEGNERCSRRY